MKNLTKLVAGGALSAVLALAAGAATAQAAPSPSRSCFLIHEWKGWSSPDPSTLYLKVNMREVYRVDLAPGGPSLRRGGDFLVSKVRGSSTICSPLDLDLAISDQQGFKTPLFPRAITRLSQEQVAAIPAKYRP